MDKNTKQVKIGNSFGTIPVGSPSDPTRTTAQTDSFFQNMANQNPELADNLMTQYGYSNAPVSNVITPQNLQQQTPITGLPTTPVTTEAPKPTPIDYDAMFGLTDFQKQAEQTQETGISEIIKSMGVLQNEATDLQAERQRRGLEDLYKQGQATKSRITALDAEMQQDDIVLAQKMRNEERRDTLLPFAQMGQAKLAGDAAIYRGLKTAEKNTLISQQLAQQGEIALAEQFAKDAIDAKYAPYKQNIENYKTILEIIKPSLTAAENKRLKAQEMKVVDAQNQIKKAEEEEKTSNSYLFTAIQGKAPQSLIAKAQDLINKGAKANEVAKVLGDYSMSVADKLELELKKAQINSANASAASSNRANRETGGKLLSVTEAQAAGVPYGTTEGQLMLMGNQQKGPKTDFNFLKQTAQKASDLSGGAGNTWLNEAIANTFGISEKKRLGPLTDTLRVNVLTMSTDPNIKKFFGPQMTENDVRMMTGAGTTLDPNTQNTADYAAEAARIYDMVNRAQIAVEEGLKQEQLSSYIDSTGTALQAVNSPFIK